MRRMVHIALFHSVLGVRPGIIEVADRLRANGHDLLVVDQYDGQAAELLRSPVLPLCATAGR